eukprot:7157060-Prymnesium_polylepis.1
MAGRGARATPIRVEALSLLERSRKGRTDLRLRRNRQRNGAGRPRRGHGGRSGARRPRHHHDIGGGTTR